jgi:ribonuclease HI
VDQKPVPVPAATVVYTDGASSGNPGPGGWAWAVPRGRYASGARAWTTNQRMEIMAVLEAAKAFDGPLEVVSDSACRPGSGHARTRCRLRCHPWLQ